MAPREGGGEGDGRGGDGGGCGGGCGGAGGDGGRCGRCNDTSRCGRESNRGRGTRTGELTVTNIFARSMPSSSTFPSSAAEYFSPPPPPPPVPAATPPTSTPVLHNHALPVQPVRDVTWHARVVVVHSAKTTAQPGEKVYQFAPILVRSTIESTITITTTITTTTTITIVTTNTSEGHDRPKKDLRDPEDGNRSNVAKDTGQDRA